MKTESIVECPGCFHELDNPNEGEQRKCPECDLLFWVWAQTTYYGLCVEHHFSEPFARGNGETARLCKVCDAVVIEVQQ